MRMEIFKDKDTLLVILGASISLISSLLILLIQVLIERILSNRGKVRIYIKSVYSKGTQKPWGFYSLDGKKLFIVPLWIEIHNTKSVRQIVRNINLVLYNNKKKVAKMTQLSHFEKSKELFSYGENGAYSFLLEANEIKRFVLEFIIFQKEFNTNFDEVRISYFDSKDKYHEFKIFDIDEPWTVSNNKIDDDWRSIN